MLSKKKEKKVIDGGSRFQSQINNFVFDQKWKLSREIYIYKAIEMNFKNLKNFLTRKKFACDSTNGDRVILVGSKGYRSKTWSRKES